MMLITPLTALAPQVAPPGPRMTSIRSMSASTVSCTSQKTPENAGEKTVRPSTSTSNLLAKRPLSPRAVTAQALALICATSMPGAMRKASGIVCAPMRRMSSPVMIKTAAAAWETVCGFLETDVISRLSTSLRSRSKNVSCARETEHNMSQLRPVISRKNGWRMLKMFFIVKNIDYMVLLI